MTACLSDHANDFRQIHGFVASRLRPWTNTAWQQIRRIRLNKQSVVRNVANNLKQVLTAPLVARWKEHQLNGRPFKGLYTDGFTRRIVLPERCA